MRVWTLCSWLVVALVAMMTIGSMTATAQQTVAEREKIRERRIHRVTEWRYAYANSRPATQGRPWAYHEYDRRGNLTVTGRFTSDSRDSPMYVREYDSENRPVKRSWFCERTDEKPLGKPCLVFRDYRLDQHGNVVEENGYELDGTFVVRVTFRRNSAGQPLKRHEYFGEHSPKNRSYRYTYNEQGDAVETVTLDADGKSLEVRRTHYTYDRKGRLVKWHVTDEKGKAVGGSRHAYDEHGNRIETVDINAQGQPVRIRRFVYEFWG